MDTMLPLYAPWKRQYGFATAIFLSYLKACERTDGEWFTAPVSMLDRQFHISPSIIGDARTRLEEAGVITTRSDGRSGYEYKINHDVLNQIDTESEK